jgi:predicted  nucleic acid-binding Zn ribbon protein
MLRRGLLGAQLLAFMVTLGVFAVAATACEGGGGGGAELTSLATSLSGGGKEGETITVTEGTKVKDKATLSGKNASTATGKVTYKVYSDKECKTLVKEAGEVTVTSGSVPASSELELEAGKTYYWQAHYSGDSKNDESTSPCTETLNVQAKTSLATKLSGGGEEGGEITIDEGAKAKDKATLSGTNSSTAGGHVTYKVYSDSECKTLVKEAGEETVSSGSVPASSEEELEGGKIYYWQAHYGGDSLHLESTSSCSEILKVKAKTSLSTTLSGGGEEGAEITIDEGAKAKDKATLSGTNSSTAGGKVAYKVYSDSECKTLVKEAGEVTVSSGSVPASSEEELEGGKTYYWQAHYAGDSLHLESTSSCSEILKVKAKTSLSTTLSGGGEEGAEITIDEGAKAKDKATLSGTNSSTAGGHVVFKVYSDSKCEHLVTEAGEEAVSSGSVPASSEEELEGGKAYYWQAHYGGDSLHQESTSSCDEKLNVKAKTSLSTTLSAESKEAEELTILEGAKAKDKATLSGTNSSTAGGHVVYKVYSDKECKTLVTEAGEETVSAGSVPTSSEEELEGGAIYYWQAHYVGDSLHQESTSSCGEVLSVKAKTKLTTKLSGEGKEGEELTILEGAKADDKATLSGPNAGGADGHVVYKIYSDSKCEHLVTEAGEVTVSSGSVPASSEEELEAGKSYYWQAHYAGDTLHQESTSSCSEVLNVKAKTSLSTTLSGGGKEGAELTINEGSKATDTATVEGATASTAEGHVIYKVYSDSECKDLVAEAGEKSVTSGVAAASNEEELEGGKTYYWQAHYTGDSRHEESTSSCGKEILTVKAKTTLATTLSGEGKEGAELTILEGAKAKDTSTLSGTNSSTASGETIYKVYSDSECKTLVANAGEETVTLGSVPDSSELELEAGKTYYWQAHYTGDSLHQETTSNCSEVLNVKAKITLSTKLSGEGKEGEELTVLEGAKAKDTAALSGTNASTAAGKVTYKVYSDSKCEDLVASAGEGTVSGESVGASGEEELEGGVAYYLQAHYGGDALHEESTSSCGSEVLNVKAKTSLSTTLSGEGKEGAELTVLEGSKAKDKAALSGANSATAAGSVTYEVYSDSKCEHAVTSAGEGTVSGVGVGASGEKELEGGKTYYWQASYGGDGLHQSSNSACNEVLKVKAKTTLTTKLTGESEEGEILAIAEGIKARDTGSLSGANSSTATGKVIYRIYSDKECKTLVGEAGEVTLESGAKIPASDEEELPAGSEYYWQATYGGDSLHQESTSSCGKEILHVCLATEPDRGMASGVGSYQVNSRLGPELDHRIDTFAKTRSGVTRIATRRHKRHHIGSRRRRHGAVFLHHDSASTLLAGQAVPSARTHQTVTPHSEAAAARLTRRIGAAVNLESNPILDAPLAASTFMSPFAMPNRDYINSLLADEVTSYTQEGLSTMNAQRAIRVQGELDRTNMVRIMQTALGHLYAGVWFEAATALLHVGAISPRAYRIIQSTSRRLDMAGHVVATYVGATSAALIATQRRWNHELQGLFEQDNVETALEPQHNAVSVDLSSSVPARVRKALMRKAAASQFTVLVTVVGRPHLGMTPEAKECDIFTGDNANCEPSITAGVEIWSNIVCISGVPENSGGDFFPTKQECLQNKSLGSKGTFERQTYAQCSAGPAAIPVAHKDQTVLLTAGHCIERGGGLHIPWWGANRDLDEGIIGRSQAYAVGSGPGGPPTGEYGDIEIEPAPNGEWQTGNARDPVLAVTARWEQGAEARYPIAGEILPAVGTKNCHEGAVSGGVCDGKVTGLNISTDIRGKKIEGLVEDTAKSRGGDSGGPWFFVGDKGEIYMEGTHAGKLVGFFGGVSSVYEPLKQPVPGAAAGSLEALKLELLTTANELRKPRIQNDKGGGLSKNIFSNEGGDTVFEAIDGAQIACAASAGTGEASSTSAGTINMKYIDCKGFGTRCRTPASANGEMELDATYNTIFVTASGEVAVTLNFTEATVECGKINCEGEALEKLKIRGNAIGVPTPIDEEIPSLGKFTIAFAQSKGIQALTEYETEEGAKVKAVLEMEGSGTESFSFEQAGLSDTDELQFEETAEIEG